ncbi:hypothetical protein V6N13_140167 [Hibiscus sabdariffa]
MFGSPPAIAYFHSPHLRKPGAKPAGADETGNGGEMKGTIPHLYTPAMMPSPVFLWRFKVALFLVWGFICCKIGWGSVMRMNADVRDLFLYEAFLYYNPLLLVCSIWMTIIVPTSMTTYLYLYSHGEVSLAASQPVLLVVLLSDAFYKFSIMPWVTGHIFMTENFKYKIIGNPPISFPDFFLADILTSMAKVFSDLERSVCRMVHHQVATIAWLEADSVCGSHSAAIPLVLVIPYTWRLMQCLRQYMDTKEKTTLLNGLFLGDRKRLDLAVYVDVQIVCSSPPQLLDSVYDYHLRDAQKVSMDILPDRKRVE